MKNAMRNGLGVVAVLLTAAVAADADAAPGTSNPQVSPRVTPAVPQTPIQLVKRVDVEVLPVSTKCGSPYATKVKLTNKMGEDWSGRIDVIVDGVKKSENVSLTNGEIKAVDAASSKSLDCKKALGAPVVEVWHAEGRGGKVFGKALHPTTITMLQGFGQPPPNAPAKVWLRRVEVVGTCGQVPTPQAHLMLTGAPPIQAQQATVKLGFGAVKSDVSVLVNPNQVAAAKLPVSAALDCQAATGIPAMTFEFAGAQPPTPTSGSISANEVTFEQ